MIIDMQRMMIVIEQRRLGNKPPLFLFYMGECLSSRMLMKQKFSGRLERETTKILVIALCVSVFFSCARKNDVVPDSEIVALVGATIIDGSGGEPIKDG